MNILSQGYEDNERDYRLEQFERDARLLGHWILTRENALKTLEVADNQIEYLGRLMGGLPTARVVEKPE